MSNLNNLISSTDYATIRMLSTITGTISVPAVAVAAGSSWTSTVNNTVPSGRQVLRSNITVSGLQTFPADIVTIDEGSYTLYISATKTTDTNVAFFVYVENAYGSTITLTARTVSFSVAVLLSPFQP